MSGTPVWKSVVGYDDLYEISSLFGVDRGAVQGTKLGRTWRHVA